MEEINIKKVKNYSKSKYGNIVSKRVKLTKSVEKHKNSRKGKKIAKKENRKSKKKKQIGGNNIKKICYNNYYYDDKYTIKYTINNYTIIIFFIYGLLNNNNIKWDEIKKGKKESLVNVDLEMAKSFFFYAKWKKIFKGDRLIFDILLNFTTNFPFYKPTDKLLSPEEKKEKEKSNKIKHGISNEQDWFLLIYICGIKLVKPTFLLTPHMSILKSINKSKMKEQFDKFKETELDGLETILFGKCDVSDVKEIKHIDMSGDFFDPYGIYEAIFKEVNGIISLLPEIKKKIEKTDIRRKVKYEYSTNKLFTKITRINRDRGRDRGRDRDTPPFILKPLPNTNMILNDGSNTMFSTILNEKPKKISDDDYWFAIFSSLFKNETEFRSEARELILKYERKKKTLHELEQYEIGEDNKLRKLDNEEERKGKIMEAWSAKTNEAVRYFDDLYFYYSNIAQYTFKNIKEIGNFSIVDPQYKDILIEIFETPENDKATKIKELVKQWAMLKLYSDPEIKRIIDSISESRTHIYYIDVVYDLSENFKKFGLNKTKILHINGRQKLEKVLTNELDGIIFKNEVKCIISIKREPIKD